MRRALRRDLERDMERDLKRDLQRDLGRTLRRAVRHALRRAFGRVFMDGLLWTRLKSCRTCINRVCHVPLVMTCTFRFVCRLRNTG